MTVGLDSWIPFVKVILSLRQWAYLILRGIPKGDAGPCFPVSDLILDPLAQRWQATIPAAPE